MALKSLLIKTSVLAALALCSHKSFAQYYDLQIDNHWAWSLGKVKIDWYCNGVRKDTDDVKFGKKKKRGLDHDKCKDINQLEVAFRWAGKHKKMKKIAVYDYGKALDGKIKFTELDGNGNRNVCLKIENGYNVLNNKGC